MSLGEDGETFQSWRLKILQYQTWIRTQHCRVLCSVACTLPCVQDMISVPGKITAMENWGLSMYNRQAPTSIDWGKRDFLTTGRHFFWTSWLGAWRKGGWLSTLWIESWPWARTPSIQVGSRQHRGSWACTPVDRQPRHLDLVRLVKKCKIFKSSCYSSIF